jgi:7-cyano-7-deazaguanine reductase
MDTLKQAEGLKSLGSKASIPDQPAAAVLETFPNSHPDRNYIIEFASDEFASHCPKTGQPDFATYRIRYIANEKCVESKALKLYMQSWMNAPGAFMERITNEILSALVDATQPRGMVVEMFFKARGGIVTNVRADYLDRHLPADLLCATSMALEIYF